MTIELTYLVYVAVFTVLMWVPYILNLIAVRGLSDAVGYPADPKATASCAMVYFWARIVHALAYTFAIPWLRTLAFAIGVGATLCIAAQLL